MISIRYIIVSLLSLVSFSLFSQDGWHEIKLSEIDTHHLRIVKLKRTYGSGKTEKTGTYKMIRINYANLFEETYSIGQHYVYRRNGRVKQVQHYTDSGFMIADTIYRRNGNLKVTRVFKTEYSKIDTDGFWFRIVDRFFYATYCKLPSFSGHSKL